jgi:hypothetical protein
MISLLGAGAGIPSQTSTSLPQSWPRAPTTVVSQPEPLVVRGAGGRAHRPRAALPAVEQRLLGRRRRVVDEHLVRQVLQHDGVPGHLRYLPHDLRRLRALDREFGKGLVYLLGGAQLGQLRVDDPRVHRLRNGHETGVAAERDHRQAVLLGGEQQRLRRGLRIAPTELDDQAGGAEPGQVGYVLAERLAVVRPRDGRGKHQFPAAQDLAHVGQLGHVHQRTRGRGPPRRHHPGLPRRTASRASTSATVG